MLLPCVFLFGEVFLFVLFHSFCLFSSADAVRTPSLGILAGREVFFLPLLQVAVC